eukprot:COSAG04_NODE_8230_length_1004_cov_1.587845_2_plen_126_part_00
MRQKFSWATSSPQARIDAITRKNELAYNTTRAVFTDTDVRIAFYDRGKRAILLASALPSAKSAANRAGAVHWRPELNKTVCAAPIGPLPRGWCMRTGFSFKERFEASSPFTISLVRPLPSLRSTW